MSYWYQRQNSHHYGGVVSLIMNCLVHGLPRCYPSPKSNGVFPVGQNASDLGILLLCATFVKGQVPTLSRPDSPDIVKISCDKNGLHDWRAITAPCRRMPHCGLAKVEPGSTFLPDDPVFLLECWLACCVSSLAKFKWMRRLRFFHEGLELDRMRH